MHAMLTVLVILGGAGIALAIFTVGGGDFGIGSGAGLAYRVKNGQTETGRIQTVTAPSGKTRKVIVFKSAAGKVETVATTAPGVTLPGNSRTVTLPGGQVTILGPGETVVNFQVKTQTQTATEYKTQIVTNVVTNTQVVTQTIQGPPQVVTETVQGPPVTVTETQTVTVPAVP
jgi:hypothetical protein